MYPSIVRRGVARAVERPRPRQLEPWLYLLPALAWFLLLVVYPLGYVVDLSFRNWRQPDRPYVGLAHYATLVQDERLWSSLQTTLVFGLASGAASFALGLALALLLSCDRLKWPGLFRSLILLPYLVSPIAAGLTWKLMLAPVDGIINYLLGTRGTDWLGSPGLALPAVIAVAVWQWIPFHAVVLMAGLLALPREPYEAAQLDGANALQAFRSLTLPLLRPVIQVAILINMIDVLKVFALVFALTEGGPGRLTEVVGWYVYQMGFRFLRVDYASALALFLVAVTALMTVGLMRATAERER